MEWRPYRNCCHTRALDPTVRVCPDCGHLLLRCRGYEECRALLSPGDHCSVHVAPRLLLRPDTGLSAHVSDRVDLPLVLANASGCGAPLRVREITRVASGGQPHPVRLYWDRLPAGEERELSVDSGPLETGGRTRVTIRIVLTSSLSGEEDDYAFAAHVPIRVEGPTARRITQHIHVEGGQFAAGAAAVIQTGPSIHEGFHPASGARDEAGIVPLNLQRAEAFELRRGIRGYSDPAMRIERTVEFMASGFPVGDAPDAPFRPFVDGVELRLGRNGIRGHDRNPDPSDLSLRVYDRDGALDAERSWRVSGIHAVLFLRNDRLHVEARGRNGTWIDGRKLEPGETATILPGARLQPLEPGGGGPVLALNMASTAGHVTRVNVLRRRESDVLP